MQTARLLSMSLYGWSHGGQKDGQIGMPVVMEVGLRGSKLHMGSGLSKIGDFTFSIFATCDMIAVLCRWVESCRNMKFR